MNNEQKVIAGTIDGLIVKPLEMRLDDRGYLYEMVHDVDLPKFGQVYAVGSIGRGTLRAFHKHDVLWDLFSIVRGSAKFVFVDDRKESKTNGVMQTVILSERSPTLIIVPPGIYHGWMALEDHALLISTASERYNQEKPDEYRIDPQTFGDVWTVKGR